MLTTMGRAAEGFCKVVSLARHLWSSPHNGEVAWEARNYHPPSPSHGEKQRYLVIESALQDVSIAVTAIVSRGRGSGGGGTL